VVTNTGIDQASSSHDGDADDNQAYPVDDLHDQPIAKFKLRSPATIVLAIAVVLAVSGFIVSALGTGTSSVPTLRSVTLADGAVVRVEAGATAFSDLEASGQPPTDVLDALAVPAGSTKTGTVDIDQGAGQYDRKGEFTSLLSSGEVQEFYQTALRRLGWSIVSNGPDPQQAGANEVLGKIGSNDGYYWEAGMVISPTTSAGVTPFTVEIFELPDPD
jgi:hypothetical protein